LSEFIKDALARAMQITAEFLDSGKMPESSIELGTAWKAVKIEVDGGIQKGKKDRKVTEK